MCVAQGPQRSDASEAQTRGPSVLSQTLYHWAPWNVKEASTTNRVDPDQTVL